MQEIKFKLTNPFFFQNSKKKFRNIKYELDDLDDTASSVGDKTDIQGIVERYEKLIKDVEILKDDLAEERTSGIVSSLKGLVPWGIATFFASYVVLVEYLQLDIRFVGFALVVFIFGVLFLLLSLNYILYSARSLISNKIALTLSCTLIILIIAFTFFDSESVSTDLTPIPFIIFLMLVLIFLGTLHHKTKLLKKELTDLKRKFFKAEIWEDAEESKDL